MAFTEPTDRRIARHLADFRTIKRDQCSARTNTPCGLGGFTASVTATDNDNIVALFHVKHSLTDTETREDFTKDRLGPDIADQAIKSHRTVPKIFGHQFDIDLAQARLRRVQSLQASFQFDPLSVSDNETRFSLTLGSPQTYLIQQTVETCSGSSRDTSPTAVIILTLQNDVVLMDHNSRVLVDVVLPGRKQKDPKIRGIRTPPCQVDTHLLDTILSRS